MPLPSQYEKITARAVIAMMLSRMETGSSAWVNDLAAKVNSNQATEDYGFLGTAPALREFIGGRSLKEIKENSFSITNKDYENSVRFRTKDMRRDKTGMIRMRIDDLTDRVNDHPASLLSTLIMNGESTPCYDGQYFFDTDHSDGKSGSLSNDVGYTVTSATAPTSDEMAEAVLGAIQAMYGFKDDQGEPVNQNARRFGVMVPVPFMGATLKAVKALLGSGGASATIPALSGDFEIVPVVNPRLTWTTKFATFRLDSNAKPFILQQEGAPGILALGEGSEYEQLHKEQIYGWDWSGNVGYGMWQGAVLTTLST